MTKKIVKKFPTNYCLANQFTAFDLDGDEFVTKDEIRQGLFWMS